MTAPPHPAPAFDGPPALDGPPAFDGLILGAHLATLDAPAGYGEVADGALGWLWSALFNAGFGVLAGALVLAAVSALARLRRRPAA